MGDVRTLFSASGERAVKIAICMSGAGSNAEVLLDFLSADNGNITAAVIFTDCPESSRAIEIGKKYNIPVEHLDIRRFYAEHGEDDIRLNSEKRRQLRDEWSSAVWQILQNYHCDFAVFAGFVPLTNLAEKLPCLNVHPGDLTVEKDGSRVYAGLHFEPVERAILDGQAALRSSVILVQSYSGDGKKELDGGLILGISAPVPVDLEGISLEELQQIRQSRIRGPFNDKLRKIAADNVEELKVSGDHVVLPPVVRFFAEGRYGIDKDGKLHFRKDDGSWMAVKTLEFSPDKAPQLLPAAGKRKLSGSKLWRYCKFMYTRIVRDNGSPDYIARGWALGMFVGCVIPVFCQLIIAVPLSFVFRGSKVGAALGTFITTPPTAVFIYPVQIWVGNKIIHGELSPEAAGELLKVFNSETLSFAEKWSAFADLGWSLVGAFFAGGLLWGAIMSPLTYFLVRLMVVRYRRMREAIFAAVRKKNKA